MRYIRWTAQRLLPSGFKEMLTEVNDLGYVVAEVGRDFAGDTTHRMPDPAYEHGDYPYFESSPIDIDVVLQREVAVEISYAEFMSAWNSAKGPA